MNALVVMHAIMHVKKIVLIWLPILKAFGTLL